MSDTAKELREKLRSARFSEALHDVAQRAIARAAQLERGIERANERAFGFCGIEGGREWFDSNNNPPDSVMYTSLMQLIEELGREGD